MSNIHYFRMQRQYIFIRKSQCDVNRVATSNISYNYNVLLQLVYKL